jgi:SAM-dependent methyltransferase
MNNYDAFIDPKLRLCSMDIFIIRRAIFAALKQVLPILSGTMIDVGCGQMPYRETIMSFGQVKNYIGLDLEQNEFYRNSPDLTWDGLTILLKDNSVDCAMATEFFEHCPEPELVMKEICRVLRPGGKMFFTVPFLWPLHDVPNDQYRYTPFSLKRHLTESGFNKIHLHALGGWNECLAQMIGLYVRRKPMCTSVKLLASFLALPLMYLLSRNVGAVDQNKCIETSQTDFTESNMISGIWGVAYKPL